MHPDGCKPTLGTGRIYINGTEFVGEGITDYDYSTYEEASDEYFKNNIVLDLNKSREMSFTATCVFNRIAYLKIIGVWDWVLENCKLGRVKHLMKYGKNERIRWKNFKRAVRDIGKYVKEK